MAKNHILLTDADAEHAEIIDLALRNAGYRVAVAGRSSEALEILTQSEPCVGVFNFSMPVQEGRALLAALKERDCPSPSTKWIFLATPSELEQYPAVLRPQRVEYLNKPVYLRELVARIRLVLDQKRRERWNQTDEHEATFSGSLCDLSILDLVQQIDLGQKSGKLSLEVEDGKGSMWFQEGQILDVSLGRLQAEAAFYRLLRYETGRFSLSFKSIRRANVMKASTRRLVLEGLRRRQEWERLCEQLPPLDTTLEAAGIDRNSQSVLSADAATLVHRFHAGRSALEILAETNRDELELLRLVSEAYFQGALQIQSEEAPRLDTKKKEAEESSDLPFDISPISSPNSSSRRGRKVSLTEPIAEMDVRARFSKRGKATSEQILDKLSSKLGEIDLASDKKTPRVENAQSDKESTVGAHPPDRSPPNSAVPHGGSRVGRPTAKTLTIPFGDLDEDNEAENPGASSVFREISNSSADLEAEARNAVPLRKRSVSGSSRSDFGDGRGYLSETKIADDPNRFAIDRNEEIVLHGIRRPSKPRLAPPKLSIAAKPAPSASTKSPPTLRGVSAVVGKASEESIGPRKAPPAPPPHMQSSRSRSRTAAFLPEHTPGNAALKIEPQDCEPDFVMEEIAAANDLEKTLEIEQSFPVVEIHSLDGSKAEQKAKAADSSPSRHNRERLTYTPTPAANPWYNSMGAWMACAVTVTLIWSKPWVWLGGTSTDEVAHPTFEKRSADKHGHKHGGGQGTDYRGSHAAAVGTVIADRHGSPTEVSAVVQEDSCDASVQSCSENAVEKLPEYEEQVNEDYSEGNPAHAHSPEDAHH